MSPRMITIVGVVSGLVMLASLAVKVTVAFQQDKSAQHDAVGAKRGVTVLGYVAPSNAPIIKELPKQFRYRYTAQGQDMTLEKLIAIFGEHPGDRGAFGRMDTDLALINECERLRWEIANLKSRLEALERP